MDQLSIEKGLTISYLLCAIMGIISSVTTGIAWGHWYLSLDQCGIGRNCSCILYGQNTFSRFLGGGQAPCIWITYGPLLYVFLAICMTCFHGYRVLFTTKSPKMRTKRSVIARMNHGSSVQIETIAQEDISSLYRCFWITIYYIGYAQISSTCIHRSVSENSVIYAILKCWPKRNLL
ncbi:uncharacterized protein LOC115886466 isoform X2 [Sitophilus oryzae]|uniref:Uncharacterized protein LOC115886466 isoform X2 n=1 Tax=Sitophilus oryzae TaxID=7048 RepID=A0A6J2YDL9_SITOR|nr:uncharacterized protein LOC115886466 isoform X2 [Sitophilus oryzae]